MRVLNMTKTESTTALFDTIHSQFKELGLNPNKVTIINGTEEGMYGWIAANYAGDKLLSESVDQETYSIVEMGGASAQIAQQVKNDVMR